MERDLEAHNEYARKHLARPGINPLPIKIGNVWHTWNAATSSYVVAEHPPGTTSHACELPSPPPLEGTTVFDHRYPLPDNSIQFPPPALPSPYDARPRHRDKGNFSYLTDAEHDALPVRTRYLTDSVTPPNLGDARFELASDSMAPCFDPAGSSIVPLAQGLTWDTRKQEGHAIGFGTTRGGKGVSCIMPALLSYGGSMLVFDIKGAGAYETAPQRRRMGQNVRIIDPCNIVNAEFGSQVGVTEAVTKYNPLAHLRTTDRDFGNICLSIADALTVPDPQGTHFSDSYREFLSGIIGHVVETIPGFGTLGDVRDIMASPVDQLISIIQQIVKTNPGGFAAKKLGRYAEKTNEVGSVRGTAITQSGFLDSIDFRESLETEENPFDIAELGTSPTTIYLVLPVDKVDTHARWFRLVLTMALRAIGRQPRLPALPVLFICDEMHALGKLTILEKSYGLLAGKGIRLWTFFQNIGQLTSLYGKDAAENFVGNADIQVFVNARGKETSEYLSNILGDTTEKKTSQWTLDHTREMQSSSVVAEDRDLFSAWVNLRHQRTSWEVQRRRQKWDAVRAIGNPRGWNAINEGDPECVHPERRYPGRLVVEAVAAPPDYTTPHDQFQAVPLMLPQDIRELPASDVIVISAGRGKFRLRRVTHHLEPGWSQCIRQNPNYGRKPSRPAVPSPASAAIPAPSPVVTEADMPVRVVAKLAEQFPPWVTDVQPEIVSASPTPVRRDKPASWFTVRVDPGHAWFRPFDSVTPHHGPKPDTPAQPAPPGENSIKL